MKKNVSNVCRLEQSLKYKNLYETLTNFVPNFTKIVSKIWLQYFNHKKVTQSPQRDFFGFTKLLANISRNNENNKNV